MANDLTSKERRFVEAVAQGVGHRDAVASIYGIRPQGGEIFYIGSTVTGLKRRLWVHLRDCLRFKHCNVVFQDRVLECGTENIEIVEIEVVPLDQRFVREYALIGAYGDAVVNVMRTERQERHYAESRQRRAENDRVNCQHLLSRLLMFYVFTPAEKLTHVQRLASEIFRSHLGKLWDGDKRYIALCGERNYQLLRQLQGVTQNA